MFNADPQYLFFKELKHTHFLVGSNICINVFFVLRMLHVLYI